MYLFYFIYFLTNNEHHLRSAFHRFKRSGCGSFGHSDREGLRGQRQVLEAATSNSKYIFTFLRSLTVNPKIYLTFSERQMPNYRLLLVREASETLVSMEVWLSDNQYLSPFCLMVTLTAKKQQKSVLPINQRQMQHKDTIDTKTYIQYVNRHNQQVTLTDMNLINICAYSYIGCFQLHLLIVMFSIYALNFTQIGEGHTATVTMRSQGGC